MTSRYPGLDDGARALPRVGTPGQGDLSELFLRYHAELVRLALLLVGDQATAEDVVQDVFTRLHAGRWPGTRTGSCTASSSTPTR